MRLMEPYRVPGPSWTSPPVRDSTSRLIAYPWRSSSARASRIWNSDTGSGRSVRGSGARNFIRDPISGVDISSLDIIPGTAAVQLRLSPDSGSEWSWSERTRNRMVQLDSDPESRRLGPLEVGSRLFERVRVPDEQHFVSDLERGIRLRGVRHRPTPNDSDDRRARRLPQAERRRALMGRQRSLLDDHGLQPHALA